MRKECNVEDKMLMNSSRCKAVKQGKLKKKERITTNRLPFMWCIHAPMTKVTS
jgi:hypothetical protein